MNIYPAELSMKSNENSTTGSDRILPIVVRWFIGFFLRFHLPDLLNSDGIRLVEFIISDTIRHYLVLELYQNSIGGQTCRFLYKLPERKEQNKPSDFLVV